jgi:hypothetical protein
MTCNGDKSEDEQKYADRLVEPDGWAQRAMQKKEKVYNYI